jgi:hypothetical protein
LSTIGEECCCCGRDDLGKQITYFEVGNSWSRYDSDSGEQHAICSNCRVAFQAKVCPRCNTSIIGWDCRLGKCRSAVPTADTERGK